MRIRFFICGWMVLLACTNLYAGVARYDSASFRKADSVAALYHDHSLKDLKALSIKLTGSLSTETEKFRAIYKWVCDNIDNDYDLNIRNQQKRAQLKDPAQLAAWNKKASTQAFKNLIEKKKTVCTGYAALVRELALHAGLDCKVVNGYGRTVRSNIGGEGIANHSWNAIRLDGQWYLCDPTWSSGAYDVEKSVFIRRFSEGYFLANPALFARNHYPLDTSWLLLRDKPALQTFLDRPLVYGDAFNYSVEPVLPGTFEVVVKKGEEAVFQFVKREGKVMKKIVFQVQAVKTNAVAGREVFSDGSVRYAIGHRFNRKGVFAVHVLLDDRYVFAYRVTVR